MLPLLTLHLLDVKIPANTSLMTTFFNGMRKTAEDHSALFEKEGISAEIFHNDLIAYSGIQFSLYKGAASFSAVGEKEVKALELWYKLFCEETGASDQNILIIKEQYNPAFCDKLLDYSTSNILLKKEVSEEIATLKNRYAIQDRLEKYLYGNIRAFLTRVAGMTLDDNDFIAVKVISHKRLGLKNTYHGGKLPAYEIKFSVNVYLPQTIRLGQAVSLGYGNIVHC